MEHHRVNPFYVAFRKSSEEERVSQVSQMWHTCYDTGQLEAMIGPRNEYVELRLWNHPYCFNERSARIHGFCWKVLTEEVGAQDVHLEACEQEEFTGALRIRIRRTYPQERPRRGRLVIG
jgi:hypothetical protein